MLSYFDGNRFNDFLLITLLIARVMNVDSWLMHEVHFGPIYCCRSAISGPAIIIAEGP